MNLAIANADGIKLMVDDLGDLGTKLGVRDDWCHLLTIGFSGQ
jgi:hypothetical protein